MDATMESAAPLSLLLVLLFLADPALSQVTYHVRPTPESLCSHGDCLTFSEIANDTERYFSTNTTLLFLPGLHTLDVGVVVLNNFFSVNFQGDVTSLPNITSTVYCSMSSAIVFKHIAMVKIRALNFMFCGMHNNAMSSCSTTFGFGLSQFAGPICPVLSVLFVSNFHLDSCRMEQNVLPLFLYNSTLFSSSNIFENNSGVYGGGVFMCETKAIFTGQNRFLSNCASVAGGGIYTRMSQLIFGGAVDFFRNNARTGGGIDVVNGTVEFGSCLTEFMGNWANSGGGIHADVDSLIRLSNTSNGTFINNTAKLYGGWIDVHGSLLCSGHGHFVSNVAGYDGGAISSGEFATFDGYNEFVNNSAIFGGAVSIVNGSFAMTGLSDFKENRAVYGGAVLVVYGAFSLTGVHNFSGNVAWYSGHGGYGGAVIVMLSRLMFSGELFFTNNSADYGGALAISMYGKERPLFLTANTTVHFVGNLARKRGGAIAVTNDYPFHYCISHTHDSLIERACFFQLDYHGCAIDSHENSSMANFSGDIQRHLTFQGNWANQGGTDLYGGSLEKCVVCHGTLIMTGLDVFTHLTGLSAEDYTGKSLISSDPFRVCSCNQHYPTCRETVLTYSCCPGETVVAHLVAVGQLNGTVMTIVHAKPKDYNVATLEDHQYLQLVTTTCTAMKYTFSRGFNRNLNGTRFLLFAEGPCEEFGFALSIFVEFLPCPKGFALSQSGACVCEQRLQKYTNSCDIDNRALTHSGDFWVGYDYHSHGLILHPHCPFDYCTLETVTFTLDSTDLQCAHGRSGTLCGACKSGLSLNLGSSRCTACSNMFVLLLLPFAAAGLLLIILLFTLKMTVSAGTLSGLIFYANVIAVNQSVFFPPGETNFLTVFIAWLNLDLGIETCFFDGMGAYTRTWLQFVFPLYIWSLVGLIALASHYSMTVARIIGPTNPVSVLATLFLLSYTKLLRTIIATFSFTTLDYPDDKKVLVWVCDGSVKYIEGKHSALFLAGLLAFVLLFLPYTIVLLFGQCLMACSNHKLLSWLSTPVIKSFLDAYHAPLRNTQRYWVGLLLVLRFLLFSISAVIDINSPRDPSINLLLLNITCIGLMTWIWNTGNMYKRWYNNVLESSFILNLAILAAASYQVRVEGGSKQAVVYTSVSVAFVTFLGIISYHVTERVRDTRVWRNILRPIFYRIGGTCISHRWSADPIEMVNSPVLLSPPITTTFVDLRESLLESQH